MFGILKKRQERLAAAERLYAHLNEAARNVVFYKHYNVPDNVDGRFDLVCMHVFIVMDRLQVEGKEGRLLAQKLFDVTFKQFEYALREIGIGDLSVPKHVKRMMKGLKGRFFGYKRGLQKAEDTDLIDAVRRNLYNDSAEIEMDILRDIASYIQQSAAYLSDIDFDRVCKSDFVFQFKALKRSKSDGAVSDARMVA